MPHPATEPMPLLCRRLLAFGHGGLSIAAVVLLALFGSTISLCQSALAQRAPSAPEAATDHGKAQRKAAVASRHMVATAHPLATEAGLEILRAGGSAADAAIAVQLVLGLVEPQSSGLGGGAFLVHWAAQSRELTTFDGRETAPAAARPDRFIKDGRPLPFDRAVRSGLSVGVPGTVRLMELAHQRYGRLPWARLFEAAIKLATEGFAVTPRLHGLLANDGPQRFAPPARAYFFDAQGKPPAIGQTLRNPAYAATLERLQREGAAAFYAGPIADDIVAAVRAHEVPGDITLADLAAYRAKERPPVCVPYRGHQVCGMGPPSSGALTIGQALMLLDGFSLGEGARSAMAPGPVHLIAEALKLAFADRNWYLADADFVAPPKGYLDPAYIAERRKLISPYAKLANPYPGLPPAEKRQALGEDATMEMAGTSHVSIVDGDGNAVAMTTTIEAGFGSGIWAAGFLLNNELTDFSFRPRDRDGRPIANRIEPGKRPRSSMSPTIVLDPSGKPRLVTGSAGGSRIIAYVLKVIVGAVDWQLDAQSAVSLPNFSAAGGLLEVEAPPFSWRNALLRSADAYPAIRLSIGLAPLGQSTLLTTLTSGTQAILRTPDGKLEGGADHRRESLARGD